jgi:hypothetical protein
MNSLPKGAPPSGIIFEPRLSFQIQNAGQDAGGFKMVMAGHEVILNKVNLSLDDGKFVTEVSKSVVGASVPLNFGSHIPVVEVGNGAIEGVVCGSGAVKKGIEPNRHWLSDVGR